MVLCNQNQQESFGMSYTHTLEEEKLVIKYINIPILQSCQELLHAKVSGPSMVGGKLLFSSIVPYRFFKVECHGAQVSCRWDMNL